MRACAAALIGAVVLCLPLADALFSNTAWRHSMKRPDHERPKRQSFMYAHLDAHGTLTAGLSDDVDGEVFDEGVAAAG